MTKTQRLAKEAKTGFRLLFETFLEIYSSGIEASGLGAIRDTEVRGEHIRRNLFFWARVAIVGPIVMLVIGIQYGSPTAIATAGVLWLFMSSPFIAIASPIGVGIDEATRRDSMLGRGYLKLAGHILFYEACLSLLLAVLEFLGDIRDHWSLIPLLGLGSLVLLGYAIKYQEFGTFDRLSKYVALTVIVLIVINIVWTGPPMSEPREWVESWWSWPWEWGSSSSSSSSGSEWNQRFNLEPWEESRVYPINPPEKKRWDFNGVILNNSCMRVAVNGRWIKEKDCPQKRISFPRDTVRTLQYAALDKLVEGVLIIKEVEY